MKNKKKKKKKKEEEGEDFHLKTHGSTSGDCG